MGVAGLRAFIDRVVFAYRARRLVGAVEYRAQRRRGADPYRDGGDSTALRLARRDDDRWAAGDCGGVFLCWRLRDRPQAIGLPPIGDWRHDELEIAQQQEGAGLSRKEILTRYVLLNPYIWLLSLCYVLVYVVRAAINDWGNLYMSETLGVDLVTANTAVTMFELGDLSVRWWRGGARTSCLTATAVQ